ncbi:Oidioi.mRNA.OKI2018_I69.chr2.g5494.t1.cds [Oikopleura dioica]|uniref:Oidioi.mRNA.OKI2018_I69.chr2.g5494.t1.cds n=1 Tax=Oikopleura dioica TaxID=34765 RepID=A0ABN7T441_OIKDI|nr:Oidioi.mRNA.OKI2018_I69.chr2.g5494.t1.cds [Oikopleura dioica]
MKGAVRFVRAVKVSRLDGEVSMKKPHVTSLKGRTFQVGKSETKRAALMVVDTDFVRRTIVGREETRDLRHCSRSGAYTYNRQESLISGWDHRFLKRSMCGGLWTNISSSPVKKPFLQSSLSQEKQVEALKTELTTLELRNGKTQVALPKPQKKGAAKNEASKKEEPKKAEQQEKPKNENQKKDKPKKEKKEKKPQPAKAAEPEKPVDVSRLLMKVGKIIDCKKTPRCGRFIPRTN